MAENLLRVPLHDRHVALGGRMVPFAGYEMPVQFSGIKDEHLAVRAGAGIFDVSHMGEVEVRGQDAIAAVDALVTNDVRGLVDGQALYTTMCAPDGGIIDDLIVYRLAHDHVFICVNAANRHKDVAFMKEHLPAMDAVLEDTSDIYIQLAIQGPEAEALLSPLNSDAELSELAFFRCQWMEVAGVRALVARTGYTGEDGFELYIPQGGEAIFDMLVERYVPERLALCGLGARDTLRLEARLPLYGQELSTEVNPFEAGLGWVVKLNTGHDFVGKDALIAAKEAGVTRRLRGVRLQGRGVLRPGYPIFVNDTQVGQLTSGGFAPTLDASIGLGYIDIEHADVSAAEVEIRGRRLPVALTKKPFYSRPR
ncbi:glycine cleavage system aminomethyltransferase GcvT [Lujinxingia litoralis]|uniref:Aminomethyltransferase n=1 Tax=Lujinxingia litoralis TaxID=2211119 RepID=A0A328C6V6_9DELT|nr:glycine cleavage system aminomethyltransferase GcvT [Lujinxingia litoralis]RAL23573.1 glycine cleavage system aminomethyltransferase GcvT [Lujinxingia litoralis]